MRKGFLFTLLFFSYSLYLGAQAQPYSYSHQVLWNIPVAQMPKVDVNALLKEDALNINKELPYRFGYTHKVSYNINSNGIKQSLSDGSTLWQLEIKCTGAYSVNLTFSEFNIPAGAQLYVYSSDHNYIAGPYTSRENNERKRFGTGLCRGEDVIVEYYEPFYAAFHGELNISGITQAYKDPFEVAKSFGESGSCNNNINCPAAAAWQDDKRAVALIIVNSNSFCSGAMIGNTALDGTPYFLTAYHCFDTTVASWVFTFNYESPTCLTNTDGPLNMTVHGAQLIALNSTSDFCLLQLFSVPDPSYNVYYAGWDHTVKAADSSVCIHHPRKDVKKISYANAPAEIDGWGNDDSTHWKVNWNSGVTESGSSGAPLFNPSHHIVGQLHGGSSGCGNPDMHDKFGRFDLSWNKSSDIEEQLKHWLDPLNTGDSIINGYYPSMQSDTLNAKFFSVKSPGGVYCINDTITPVIDIKNTGSHAITSLDIDYNTDGGTVLTYHWAGNINSLTNKSITLPSFTTTVGTHVFSATIKAPNGHTDQDNNDNTLVSSFDVITASSVTIEIKTDQFPSETSYELLNSLDQVVVSRKDFQDGETVYRQKICLSPGCYNFKIYDEGSDGMCCTFGNGYYKITNSSGNVLVQGGSFTSVQVKNFCISSNGINETSTETAISVYPNPAKGIVNVECERKYAQLNISVVNAIGVELKNASFYNTSNAFFDLSGFPAGIYFLHINTGDKTTIKKVSLVW